MRPGSWPWWRAAFAASLLVAAGTAPWWGRAGLKRLGYFGVRRVEVHGARYFRPERVADALGLPAGATVWEDLDGLERRLEAVRGIDRAEIVRRLPGTIVVTVAETEPVVLAQGSAGLVPVAKDGRPLPFDPSDVPIDAPVVLRADSPLVSALAAIRLADVGLFAATSAARLTRGGGVTLEVNGGQVVLEVPVNPEAVIRVAAVRRELGSRGRAWRELDGRFGGWVVVRPS